MSVKLTVVVLTYNHEPYIAKALESVLMQDTEFRTHIIVADDGSQDRTISIVKEISAKYPGTFTVLEKSSNQGVRNNVLSFFTEIKSEYVAILDGDDYWKDPQKLKKQVDFLDKNQEFNGVFHDAEIVHVDNSQTVLFNQKRYYSQSYVFKEMIFPSDMISRKIILPSSSAVLRMSALKLVNKSLLVDNYSILWKLTCFGIKWSKYYFINEAMSVYHNHHKGISKSDNEQFHLSHIQFIKNLLKDDFYHEYQYDIYSALTHEYKILLDSKQSNLNKKTLFRQYLKYEILKIWYYRKMILTYPT